MKSCKNCGSQNDEDQRICSTCGNEFLETPVDFLYFVRCSRCNSDIKVIDEKQKVFFCKTCNRKYCIDGIEHSVSKRPVENLQVNKIQEPELILEETISQHQFHICKEGGTFGRYGQFDPEFLQNERFRRVSGRHIIITYDNNSNNWYITANSETNDTYINGKTFKPLKSNIRVEIKDGHTVGLADIYFKVSIIGSDNGN